MNSRRRSMEGSESGGAGNGLQLDLFLSRGRDRWTLTRPLQASRLKDSALRQLESVRRHFPELETVTVKVGRTRSRRAHAWASLDPAHPTIWIKPGSLKRFTVAHEFVHLLQARGLLPRGEKAADLHALARHPDLIDKLPSYVRIPRLLFSVDGTPRPGVAGVLNRLAADAISESAGKPRRAVRLFEENAALAAIPSLAAVLEAVPC